MARKADRAEDTPELTGADAAPDEADFGSAGNGADPFEADLAGTSRRSRSLEPEPDAADIRPDQVEPGPPGTSPSGAAGEAAPTARPTEWPDSDASRLP
jgi:hypothetical protein